MTRLSDTSPGGQMSPDQLPGEDLTRPVSLRPSGETTIIAALAELIATLPIPGHPPRYLRAGAEYGTAFFDMALRQNHIVRQSERLQLFDVANVSRTVTLDLSLDRLSTSQFATARAYHDLRKRMRGTEWVERGAREQQLAWVVIGRLPREDTAPVAVFDAEGRAVARLTQHESRALLNAALHRVLRMILEARPQAPVAGEALHAFLHEDNRARWLLQAAIVRLVERGPLAAGAHGHSPAEEPPGWLRELTAFQEEAAARLGGGIPSPDSTDAIRATAAAVLDDHIAGQAAFLELLDLAASEYLVIVGLNAERAEHILTFEGALLSADRGSPVRRRLHRVRNALPSSPKELVVEYRSELPESLKSYHLSIEVDPAVRCRRFLHRTEADRPPNDGALADLRAVADHLEGQALADDSPERRLIEYELQSALQRIGGLVHARQEDFSRYRAYLESDTEFRPSRFGVRARLTGWRGADPPAPIDSEPATFEDLTQIADAHSEGRLTRLFDTGRGGDPPVAPTPTLFRSAPRLRAFADVVERLELGVDATADNDPRENGAHAYWTRRGRPGGASGDGNSLSVVRFTLADDAPSLFGSVVRMIAVLVATQYTVFSLLFGSPVWPVVDDGRVAGRLEADALMAVLLLVPGLLLARLDLPTTNTVLGYLRSAPKALAYSSVGVMFAIAICTASDLKPGDPPIWAPVGLWALVALLALAVVGSVRAQARRSDSGLDALHPPVWLRELAGEAPVVRPADVTFSATPAASAAESG